MEIQWEIFFIFFYSGIQHIGNNPNRITSSWILLMYNQVIKKKFGYGLTGKCHHVKIGAEGWNDGNIPS